MYVYMEVSKDKYELPLAIADTPGELAKICCTTSSNVLSCIYHKKKRFVKVKIEEDEDDQN